ncbi:hypothetical protein DICPUDRAFT_155444 [Dictyostelium purpureum]|uniref:FNIP repeat-containing protein n=1 Tax=Dictyostelium purpureum TaxID=5786 RepID=F0ZU15_DICPU|nr:uncharacterized protein DICPUDRAFT_155444 [Dictyostelium purpureum]EGC32577.1 hypothetical protein DICPUDRAFT_155444 [Dictyostelium purpureum]|eukprot:XP_003290914.1 hypothetical protein DICPUDRAFT_155444 [Dictyostelium purpureum]
MNIKDNIDNCLYNNSNIENNDIENNNIENNNIDEVLNKNNNNKINNKVYFEIIWKNIYLKGLIIYHLRIFNIHYSKKYFNSLNNFDGFQYKHYCRSVSLSGDDDGSDNPLKLITRNIDTIYYYFNTFKESTRIPCWVEKFGVNISSVEFSKVLFRELRDSNIKKLILDFKEGIYPPQISCFTMLPKNLTSLKTIFYPYTINKGMLPCGLKTLVIDHNNHIPIGEASLPDSLEFLTVKSDIPYPLTLNKTIVFPKGLVVLELKCFSEVESDFKFPKSLKTLEIICRGTFNSTLPNCLKVLKFSVDDINLNTSSTKEPIQLPPNLEKLDIHLGNSNQFINNHQMIPSKNCKSLKYLKINCTQINDTEGDSIFPNSIETLIITGACFQIKPNMLPRNLKSLSFEKPYNYPLVEDGLFPETLTHLTFYEFNQKIGANVFPENLKLLDLGIGSNYKLHEHSIPLGLLDLKIRYQNYTYLLFLKDRPNLIISTYYYRQFIEYLCPKQLRILKPSSDVDIDLSVLQLNDKSNLELLEIPSLFNYKIYQKDLPTNNNIKTLIIGDHFINPLDLDLFPNLELLVVGESNPSIKYSHNITKSKLKQINVLHYLY